MQCVEIKNWKTKLVGFGCDGTSFNIAEGGLKGFLKMEVLWIALSWCLARWLELSIKVKSIFFSTINDVQICM